MAVEAVRGCGYRKVGGLYLAGSYLSSLCCRLPAPIENCQSCGAGVKFSRGIQWIEPKVVFRTPAQCVRWSVSVPKTGQTVIHLQIPEVKNATPGCSLAFIEESTEKVALMWAGEQHYPTPEDFSLEAANLGVSKRIAALPKGLVVGKTRVLLAHKKGMECPDCHGKGVEYEVVSEGSAAMMSDVTEKESQIEVKCEGCGGKGKKPAVFMSFVPQRVERIVTMTMNAIATAWLNAEESNRPDEGELTIEDASFAVEFLADDLYDERLDRSIEKMREFFWCYLDLKRGITLVPVPDNDQDHLSLSPEKRSFPKRGKRTSPPPVQKKPETANE